MGHRPVVSSASHLDRRPDSPTTVGAEGAESMRFRKRTGQTSHPPTCSASCRGEFLDTLRLLGARLSVPRRDRGGNDSLEVQPVLLRCPLETWKQVFGELENVVCHCIPARQRLFHTWRHFWTGECVTCVGVLPNGESDGGLVAVKCAIFHDNETELGFAARWDGRIAVRSHRHVL